jgi:hypothetical protein
LHFYYPFLCAHSPQELWLRGFFSALAAAKHEKQFASAAMQTAALFKVLKTEHTHPLDGKQARAHNTPSSARADAHR